MADGLLAQEVQELIRIANGDVKEKRARWYTLGIPINCYYNLSERVEAIRQLGLSRNPNALDYLRKLTKESESYLHAEMIPMSTGSIFQYPNAKGELGSALEKVNCPYHEVCNSEGNKEVWDVINKSISELEKVLY